MKMLPRPGRLTRLRDLTRGKRLPGATSGGTREQRLFVDRQIHKPDKH